MVKVIGKVSKRKTEHHLGDTRSKKTQQYEFEFAYENIQEGGRNKNVF